MATPTTSRPSQAAAEEVTAGPPLGMRYWTTQVHQFSGSSPCRTGGRPNSRPMVSGEPGLTSTVQASNSSCAIGSPCARRAPTNRSAGRPTGDPVHDALHGAHVPPPAELAGVGGVTGGDQRYAGGGQGPGQPQ